MSAARRAVPRSLTGKLVAGLAMLAVLGIVLVGALSVIGLRDFLGARVDQQLAGVAHRDADRRGDGRPGPGMNMSGRGGPPSDYFVRVLAADGRTVADISNPLDDVSPPALPALSRVEVEALNETPFSVSSVDGSMTWRVIAVKEAGAAGSVLVAAPLGPVDSVVRRLVLVEAAVGLVVAALLAALAFALVRRSMRPLVDVEIGAETIASGDFAYRVPDEGHDTEVGRLASAFNSMADRIEIAFAAQRESEADARSSEGRTRTFLADASHELRTPLTTIRGFAELYRQGGLSDAARITRAMGRIEGESMRMQALVEDMLALARLDQQRPLAREAVDLVEVVSDSVIDAQAAQPGRMIRVDVSDLADPEIEGDENSLRQVIANLVSNALRHTPLTADVAVSVRSIDTGVEIDVSDTGPGIPSTHLPRIFERFYRADAARSRDDGGSGLGLAVVSSIVATHHGRVWVDSEEGRGSTFHIVLPRRQPVE